MKKTGLLFGIVASLLLLSSASVWEGTAGVSQALPETGLFAATNSFPVNTVVYITNLENGKTVRLVVSSGLESSGLLALLSRDAAGAIGLQEGTMGRIRMGQYTDEMAYYGYGADGISLYNPDEIVDIDVYNFPNSQYGSTNRTDDSGLFVDLPDAVDILAVPPYTYPDPEITFEPDPILTVEPDPVITFEPDPVLTVEPEPPYIASQTPENNIPRTPSSIDPSLFIEPIKDAPVPPSIVEPVRNDPVPIDPILSNIAEPVKSETVPVEPSTGFTITRLPSSASYGSASYGSTFSAPLISYLEKGSYYVQIGAYSIPETVESEIRKIDQQLPVAIMNAGSEEKPVYRVLIGPLNLGESGAILQRYKGTYKDAFVRQGT